MAGSMGGTPKGQGGSMLPPNFVEEKQREKELAALDAATSKQDRVSEEKEEQKEEDRKKKIDDLLPEIVESAYGEISYERFREIYEDVFDGVKEKDHWATGYVTHETNLPGGTQVKMRNFKRNEGDALRSLTPRASVMAGGTMEEFYQENSKFVAARITVAMMEFDGKERLPLPTLTIDKRDAWFDHDDVKKAIKWLDDLPDQIVTYLDAVVNDIMVAYNAAATENLKNQLAPLSGSTE